MTNTVKASEIKQIKTVKDLIKHLRTFPGNAQLIFDYDGNTDDVWSQDFALWDESKDDSPVAIFITAVCDNLKG
jgi:hypothetical protein